MSTYAIGDIQGCFEPFMNLLDRIRFNPEKDILWLTGDLVNRGPKSLETLRFVKDLNLQKRAITVLGNHDITLLAVLFNAIPFNPTRHTFSDILNAPDREALARWLKTQPLLHYDQTFNAVLVHAGLHPDWDLTQAQRLAQKITEQLQTENPEPFLKTLFDKTPAEEEPRFIVNCFTRMRFCNIKGELDLKSTESAENAPEGFMPWFSLPQAARNNLKILFGHWASLKGECNAPNVFALDTGCVWGNGLTALRLDDEKRFTVPS